VGRRRGGEGGPATDGRCMGLGAAGRRGKCTIKARTLPPFSVLAGFSTSPDRALASRTRFSQSRGAITWLPPLPIALIY
jgi:hypothetical protein